MHLQTNYDFTEYCDYKLVNLFNSDCCHDAWVSQRGVFLNCLFDEFKKRNINLGQVEQSIEGHIAYVLKYPVKLCINEGNKTLKQIKY